MIKRYMLYAYNKDKKIKLSDNGYHMSAASYGNDILYILKQNMTETPLRLRTNF